MSLRPSDTPRSIRITKSKASTESSQIDHPSPIVKIEEISFLPTTSMDQQNLMDPREVERSPILEDVRAKGPFVPNIDLMILQRVIYFQMYFCF